MKQRELMKMKILKAIGHFCFWFGVGMLLGQIIR